MSSCSNFYLFSGVNGDINLLFSIYNNLRSMLESRNYNVEKDMKEYNDVESFRKLVDEDDNEVEIPLAAAVALATHRRKLSFVGWPIFMDAASVTALMAHPDCDLGPYRPRRFELPDGKKIYFWEIQPEGHMARISHGVVGGETKQSLKELSQNYWIRRDQIDKLLKERFEKGFTEVAVKKPVPTGNPSQ